MFKTKKINLFILTIICFFLIFLEKNKINQDGVFYLTQANYFLEGSWDKAINFYGWPFFSILIASFHYLTNFSLQLSAHVISIFLFLLAALFFFKNIELISNGDISPSISLIILLTSILIMDDYVPMILRDHGSWAGFMMGLFYYLKWVNKPNFLLAMLWHLSFIFGALFRIECILILIFLPFIHYLIFFKTTKFIYLFYPIAILLIGLILIFFIFLLLGINFFDFNLGHLGLLKTKPIEFFYSIQQSLDLEILSSNNFFLKKLLIDFSYSFKFIFLSYVFIYKWIFGLGVLHFIFFILAVKKQLIPARYYKILIVLFIFTLLIPLFNLFTTFVLSSRYLVINLWLVNIFSSFGLNYLLKYYFVFNKKSKLIILVYFFLFLNFLNIFIDQDKTSYDQDAIAWIKNNNLDINNIYFDRLRTAYFAGLISFDNPDFDKAINVIQYKYLLIHFRSFNDVQVPNNYKPINFFPSKEIPKLVLFERTDSD